MLLNYIGGARDTVVKDMSDEDLVTAVHEDALKIWPRTHCPPRHRQFERDAIACIRRHQAFALPPVTERRFRVYEDSPDFRPGPRFDSSTVRHAMSSVRHAFLSLVSELRRHSMTWRAFFAWPWLKTILKPGTARPYVVGVKVWEKAIPQFNLGHLDVLKEAKAGGLLRAST